MKKAVKQYTLTDGSTWTALELSKKLNLTTTACRYRLDQSNKVEWVMRVQHKAMGRKKKHTCRKFTLSDGCVLSAEECAKKYNICTSTMYARLQRNIRDVDILAKLPTKGRQSNIHAGYMPIEKQPNIIKKSIMKRNAYDPMSRLFMMLGAGA